MLLKCVLIVFLLALFFSSGFCDGTDCTYIMSQNDTHTIAKQDSGKVLKVRCGDLIRIELETLGGAGYNWYIDNLNTDYAELLAGVTGNEPGAKTGGPVTGVWLFKLKKKGIAEFSMDHYRIWEGKEKAIGHFSVTLIIE